MAPLPSGSPSQPSAPSVDNTLQQIMGAFGKYHLFLCVIMFISKPFIAFNQLAIIFLAPTEEYVCGNETTPNTCPCSQPIFAKKVFTRTITMEWNLICENKWKVSFTQMMFQCGTLLGSVFFGMAADRYGRKRPMQFAVTAQFIIGVIVPFSPNYWIFTFLRYLVGMTVGGTMVIGFVFILEFVGSQYRCVLSALYQVPFNLGHMMLPMFAYLFRDYANYLLAFSAPSVIMLIYFCFLPETPRWLIAYKRTEDAIKILEKVAKVNKLETAGIREQVTSIQATISSSQSKKGHITDLFKTPNMRKNIICVSLDWFACSYCFYGVSQYIGSLSGDIFINVVCSASVTLVGTLLSIPLMKLLGRRTIIIVNCYICGISLIILGILPEGWVSVVLASIGVMSAFIVFVLVYLYTAEMFPTVVRNAAVGYCSMVARIGTIVAPFVIDLKDIVRILPPIMFAIVPLISASVSFALPETKNKPLMTTIEEGEAFGKKIGRTSPSPPK